MFGRIATAALVFALVTPAYAQESRVSSFQGRQDAEGKYKYTYAPAEDAIKCAFPRANVAAKWGDRNGHWTPTIHPAVKHLAEVDGPVQGGGGQRADSRKLCEYLKNDRHPQNGNVTQWYRTNFPDLAK